jgi:hypothetical protein
LPIARDLRTFKRQFGAEAPESRLRKRVGSSRWVSGLSERGIAHGIKTRGSLAQFLFANAEQLSLS